LAGVSHDQSLYDVNSELTDGKSKQFDAAAPPVDTLRLTYLLVWTSAAEAFYFAPEKCTSGYYYY